jgi:hypothetical protein
MSVRFPRWFGVPPELFELGHFAAIGDGAVRLYVFLCWMGDRKSSHMFEIKDSHIAAMIGLSKRSLSNARKQLSGRGLAVCKRDQAGHYAYTLCALKTGRTFPEDPRARIQHQKKSSNTVASVSPSALLMARPVASSKTVRIEGIDIVDTDFNYGHNIDSSETSINPAEHRWFSKEQFLQHPSSKK